MRRVRQATYLRSRNLQKRLKTRALKTGGYDIALVTCELEHAMLDVKVVFNSQGEVAGLFFLPSTAQVDSSKPPPYARTNEFREKNLTVGSGEWQRN